MTSYAGLDDDALHELGIDAYVYLYTLVTMEISRLQLTNVAETSDSKAPMNTFAHFREFPAADFKVVVRPNFDTLYSSVWLDLREGPIVVSAPAGSADRYYELPMYDMWTDAFAVPGWRTSGIDPADWAVVPPGWSGTLPDGLRRIDAPTPVVWIIGRTQTNGPSDYPNVHTFQNGLRVTPLRSWGTGSPAPTNTAPVDPSVDMVTAPLDLVNGMDAPTYFDTALALLEVHPPHVTDSPITMRMARIGLVPGAKFAELDPAVQDALRGAPAAGVQAMGEAFPRIARVVNGWQMNIDTMGVYGNFYVKRAVVAMVGLGANAAEDAVYPVLMTDADGAPVTGDHDYVLHFEAAELPPVDAFWSVTMYDAQGFQAPNVLNRFAIGDRDALVYNADGSLDLYLQHESPGKDEESNWLPAPAGPLGVTMRLYAPKPTVLHGLWNPPALRKVTPKA
jgi:hypothetical protein